MPPKSKSLSVPDAMRPRYEEIIALSDALCREMTATLARKRPSPLLSG